MIECSGNGECFQQVSSLIPQFTGKRKEEYSCKKSCKLTKCGTFKCKGNFPQGYDRYFCDKCEIVKPKVELPPNKRVLTFGKFKGFEIKFVDYDYLKYLAGENTLNCVEKDAFEWVFVNHPDVVREAREIILTKCRKCGLDLFDKTNPYHVECWERLISK